MERIYYASSLSPTAGRSCKAAKWPNKATLPQHTSPQGCPCSQFGFESCVRPRHLQRSHTLVRPQKTYPSVPPAEFSPGPKDPEKCWSPRARRCPHLEREVPSLRHRMCPPGSPPVIINCHLRPKSLHVRNIEVYRQRSRAREGFKGEKQNGTTFLWEQRVGRRW